MLNVLLFFVCGSISKDEIHILERLRRSELVSMQCS
jgi:hypothetical protein